MTLKTAAVGSELFLQGSYLSLGLSAFGTIGTGQAAPTDFQSDKASGYMRVGLYADLDGFGTGKASTLRDAVLPGNAVEGFTLGYKVGGAVQAESNFDRLGMREIAGTSSYSATDTVAKALWQGATKDKLAVSQTATLIDDGKYVRFDVTLTNTSFQSMTDVRYMRSMDTDQGTSFATLNKIVDQGAGKALVSSAAANGTSPAFLYADDPRAVGSIFGYKNFDPYVAVAHDAPQAKGTSISADMTINLTFDLGTLNAGKSTTLTFYVGITNDLTQTISQIASSNSAPASAPAPALNATPDAVDDSFAGAYNTAVKGSVLANDKDANGDVLKASLVSGPANGTIVLNQDGTFTYTAKSGYSGTDSFVYAASDGSLTNTATATISVGAKPNAAPDAVDDSFAGAYNTAVKGSVLANDKDANGDVLKASLVSGPANGTVVLNQDGTFTYTAKSGYSGTDSFVYAASDGSLTNTATATISVGAKPNAAPDAVDDSFAGAYNTAVKGSVLANDKDANGDVLKASLVSGPANGTVVLNQDGTFTYTAKSGYSGTDSFVYAASDGSLTNTATATISVGAKPNAAPDAVDDSFAGAYNTAVKGSVLANDKDANGDVLKASLVSGPANGTVVLNQDGTFTYTAKSGYSGTDSFVYAASDGSLTDTATATINVGAPVISTLLDRAHSTDFSDALGQTIIGKADHESFFVDVVADSGKDVVKSFGTNDVLLTTKALLDGNKDGIITFSAGTTLAVDGAKSKDTITFDGDTDALRYLGQTKAGLFVYADEEVRPFKAIESKLSDDVLSGSGKVTKATTFFFDTALDVDLGTDKLVKFGAKDLLVTTTEMAATNGKVMAEASGYFALPGGGDHYTAGDGGHVAISDIGGKAVAALEYDGAVSHNGVQYFVYSQVGSSVGTFDLLF